jgi:chromosome segregation ATPase
MTINTLSATGARLGKLTMEATGEAADRLEILGVDTPTVSEQLADLESRLEQIRADYLAQIADLQSQLKHVQDALATLEEESAPPLKIAYLNAEDAFSVFTDAVSDLRQKAIDKQMEIAKLQQDFMAGTISKDEYQNTNNRLQVELLQAQLNIDIGTIDKMIASPGFSNMRSDLQRLRDEAQPVVDEMNNLVAMVQVGVIDTQEFENRYTQVKNAFTQLDQLLTQAATAKIVEAANKVALAEGYDLVLRVKNVIIYRNAAKLIDITDLVKRELASYL